ncbi:hypothetical protein F3B05_24400, partial [Salmonella enterica subsp. enterica serovar Typhi]|nr:hypothetical protein [Salmonella enterica subsp. enterica serovar Typhi]
MDKAVKVNIGLYPDNNDEIAYEVYTESKNQKEGFTVHNQGKAVVIKRQEKTVLDLQFITEQCKEVISAEQCYETLRRMQMEYGPGFRGVEEIRVGNSLIIAKVKLPEAVKNTSEQFLLHPSILDGALQASIGFVINAIETKPSVPFAIENLEVYRHSESEMWAVIRKANISDESRVVKYDVDLCDSKGNVYVRINGYT